MKIINKILIALILFFSFFVIIGELDRGLVIVLKDSSIVLTLLFPYILRKLFKLEINEGVIFVWIVFIFLSHFLGVMCEFYDKWYYFDKISHTFSGILSGTVGLMILDRFKIKNFVFGILFILSFTCLCAFLWEVFEFVCNALFGGDAQKVMETGVTDTMLDMIVAFIGSICVCVYYYFNKNKI